MTKVILCENPLSFSDDSVYELSRVGDFLYNHFKIWPENAKLYQDIVSDETEIKLQTKEDVERLNSLQGVIWIVIYPQGYAALGIGLLIATVGIQLALKPKKSKSTKVAEQKTASQAQGSPNNAISNRSNSARLLQRIPDIYGTVKSIPDVLIDPYIVYENNRQVEYAYYCIGRGKYHVAEVKDGDTLISKISGSSAIVYGPNTSPNSGSPQLAIGQAITEPFITTKQIKSVKGQLLLAPNTISVGTYVKMRFIGPNIIQWDNSQTLLPPPNQDQDIQVDLEDHFKVGDTIGLSLTTVGLDGTYVVESVSSNQLTLENPGAVNATWNSIGTTGYGRGSITTVPPSTRSVGFFPVEDADSLIFNLVAENGLYEDILKTTDDDDPPQEVVQQRAISVTVQCWVQQLDASDTPVGIEYFYLATLTGAANLTGKVALSFRVTPPFSGKMQIRAIRTSNANLGHKGKRVDRVAWESAYAVKNVTNTHFGDVTTVRTRSLASFADFDGGRQLNCRVTRLIPSLNDLGVWVPDQQTSRFADILTAISLDPKIGNRTYDDLDLANWYTTQANVQAYFGRFTAIEFNHTFDDDNLSYEDMLNIIAEACFCDVYRQGHLLKLFFERETSVSSILFNHRNKIPRSETRTITFGNANDKDGVELEWFDNKTGQSTKYYLPADLSAVNPEKITKLGVTHKLQAYFHAHRIWNRIRYQKVAVEFDATQEAALLNVNERILVADNTRQNTFDGEIIAQDGRTLTLSQDFVFEAGKSYTIFLQLADATIQSLAISPGEYADQVILAADTTLPLAVDPNYYAQATYEIVESSSTRVSAFLVEEKNPNDRFVTQIKAVNYDSRYYENDNDYPTVVNSEGNLV